MATPWVFNSFLVNPREDRNGPWELGPVRRNQSQGERQQSRIVPREVQAHPTDTGPSHSLSSRSLSASRAKPWAQRPSSIPCVLCPAGGRDVARWTAVGGKKVVGQ